MNFSYGYICWPIEPLRQRKRAWQVALCPQWPFQLSAWRSEPCALGSGLGLTVSPPDGQVTVQYTQDNGAVIPVRIHTIVISVQHNEDITLEAMREALKEQVIKAVVPAKYLDEDTVYHLQPSGRFVIGGPQVRIYRCIRPCGCVLMTGLLLSWSTQMTRCSSEDLSSVYP